MQICTSSAYNKDNLLHLLSMFDLFLQAWDIAVSASELAFRSERMERVKNYTFEYFDPKEKKKSNKKSDSGSSDDEYHLNGAIQRRNKRKQLSPEGKPAKRRKVRQSSGEGPDLAFTEKMRFGVFCQVSPACLLCYFVRAWTEILSSQF